jgi:hypothetical protein
LPQRNRILGNVARIVAALLLSRHLEVAGDGDQQVTFQRMLLNGIIGVAMITLAACGSDGRSPSPTAPGAATVAAVAVTSASTTAPSFQLTATARMSDGTARDVTSTAAWESSNPLIATVSSTGMVTVAGNGDLDVRATYRSVTGSLHLVVASPRVVASR